MQLPGDVHNAVVGGINLHGHGLKSLRAQQLLFGHPRQALIDRIVFVPLAQSGIRLGDADDFVVVAQLPQRAHLSRSMLVPRADLANLDPLLRSIGRGDRWFEPPSECEGRPAAGGSEW